MATELDLDIGDVADQAAGPERRPHFVVVTPDMRSASSPPRGPDSLVHVGDVAARDTAGSRAGRAEHAQPAVRPGETIIALTFDEPMPNAAIKSVVGRWHVAV